MQIQQSLSRRALWEERESEVSHRSLDHLLAMAHCYHNEGSVWQATEMYWMLSEDYSGTAQSLEARQSLLAMAETYERDNARHMARAVYERLSVPA